MNVTRFAIKHFMAVLVMCVGVLLLGGGTYLRMPRENFPDIKVPVITVTTALEGANPTDVETSVTVVLETDLEGVEGLEELRSTSSEGLSVVTIEFVPKWRFRASVTRWTRPKRTCRRMPMSPLLKNSHFREMCRCWY